MQFLVGARWGVRVRRVSSGVLNTVTVSAAAVTITWGLSTVGVVSVPVMRSASPSPVTVIKGRYYIPLSQFRS